MSTDANPIKGEKPTEAVSTDQELDPIDAWAEELIGWQYGTVHKQYDREEEAETLADDVRERIPALKALIDQRVREAVRAEVQDLVESLEMLVDEHPHLEYWLHNEQSRLAELEQSK